MACGVHCRLDAHRPSTPLRSHLRKSRGYHLATLNFLRLRRDVVIGWLHRLLNNPVCLLVGASHCLLLRLCDRPNNSHHPCLRLELALLRRELPAGLPGGNHGGHSCPHLLVSNLQSQVAAQCLADLPPRVRVRAETLDSSKVLPQAILQAYAHRALIEDMHQIRGHALVHIGDCLILTHTSRQVIRRSRRGRGCHDLQACFPVLT